MDRGKAVGSIIGIALGLITMPALGPFSACVAMASAWTTKNVFDKISERTKPGRTTNISNQTSGEIRSRIDFSEYLNRDYSLPLSVNRNIRENNQRLLDIQNNLEQLQNYIPPTLQIGRNANLQREPRPSTRGQIEEIYVDKYGRIFDSQDED